jgi:hypothetical protein
MRSFMVTVLAVVCGCVAFAQGGTGWPRPIPCRINDGLNPDLFVMTLGDVTTPLTQGTFDPLTDEVRLSGRVLPHYYRDSLGVKYFHPIDKSIFPLPPSGWCSWYYYYQEIDENEVKRNAQWFSEHLKEYGASCIQIDDGWQGIGHGLGDNRDWSTIDKRFPGGMDGLAASIKKLGFKAGLWLAPHGQSNAAVVKAHPGAFLLKPDGSSVSSTWEGTYLVDPSAPAAQSYVKDLFTRLSRWGYDYFKIDGQPIVVDEFRKAQNLMQNPPDDAVALYRQTLETIRGAIGEQRYLLGCWGIPLEGIGIMNGSRTGGDVLLGWDGFKTALDATMKYYFLHNVAWYCDPDVMLVRAPMGIEQARAWATLQGLTGQALMASDRMMDLSADRVEILRRVYPAVDIRPLDLFPAERNKRIWDLKVNHLGRTYDVVGCFNFHEDRSDNLLVRWEDLGAAAGTAMHVYDFWDGEYLGCWQGGIATTILPASCKVLTLLPDNGAIQLVSTNRHITQGWVDLKKIKSVSHGTTWEGTSAVIRRDPYRLTFVFPRGKNFVVSRAEVKGYPVTIANHQGWATVEFTPSRTGEVAWKVAFGPAPVYAFPVRKPSGLSVDPSGLTGVTVRWDPQYYLTAGYEVALDDAVVGVAMGNQMSIGGLKPDHGYRVSVRSVWDDGKGSADRAEGRFRLDSLLSGDLWLSDLSPSRATIGWGTIEVDRAVSGAALTVAGTTFRKGIGTHAVSEIDFDLFGVFDTLSLGAGLDAGSRTEKGSVEFFVFVDGKERWRSGMMRMADAVKRCVVPIAGARTVRLLVTDAGDGNDYDHADWIEPRLSRKR